MSNIKTIRSLMDKTNDRANQVKANQKRRYESKLNRLNAINEVVEPIKNTWIEETLDASVCDPNSDNDYYNEVIEQGVSDNDYINDLIGNQINQIVSEKDWN